MESTIGLYKTECVCARWEGFKKIAELEQATLEWVAWFNHTRLHSSLDYRTTAEAYRAYTQFIQRELAASEPTLYKTQGDSNLGQKLTQVSQAQAIVLTSSMACKRIR